MTDTFINNFRRLQIMFTRFYSEVLTKADLTLPQYTLLNQLLTEDTVPMSHAGKRLRLSKPAITNLVDRLEEKKYLKRIPHATDRRVHLLKITSNGKKLTRKIQENFLNFLLKTLNRFNQNEKKLITRFYALLLENVENALTPRGKK